MIIMKKIMMKVSSHGYKYVKKYKDKNIVYI